MTTAAGYASKKILATPYEENGGRVPPLMGAILTGGEISGYLPLRATDNGDGSASLGVNTGTGGGQITFGAPSFATVGVASSTILAANTSRKVAVIVNDSPNVVYLAFGAAAVANRGIRLNPNGGSYEINGDNLSLQDIRAIATAAGSNVTVIEAT